MEDVYNNDKKLEAWNEWKEICSIEACNDEHSLLLRKSVSAAICGRLRKYNNAIWSQFKNDADIGGKEDYCVQMFDSAIFEALPDRRCKPIESEEPQGQNKPEKPITLKMRKKKAWKDFIWGKIDESDDPPMKIINGKLLGEFVKNVCVNYIATGMGYKWRKDKVTGHSYLFKPKTNYEDEEKAVEESDRQKFDNYDIGRLVDICGYDSDGDKKVIENCCSSMLDKQSMIIALAYYYGMKNSDERLLKALDMQKSRVSEVINSGMWKRKIKGIFEAAGISCSEISGNAAEEFIINLCKAMIVRLRAEKCPEYFLNEIESLVKENESLV